MPSQVRRREEGSAQRSALHPEANNDPRKSEEGPAATNRKKEEKVWRLRSETASQIAQIRLKSNSDNSQ